MPVPFLMQVLSDRPEAARAVAERLAPQLATRGSSVSMGDVRMGPVDGRPVGMMTGTREVRGTVVTIGLPGAHGVRWIAPLEVPDEPEQAAVEAVAFLERWGFLPRAAA